MLTKPVEQFIGRIAKIEHLGQRRGASEVPAWSKGVLVAAYAKADPDHELHQRSSEDQHERDLTRRLPRSPIHRVIDRILWQGTTLGMADQRTGSEEREKQQIRDYGRLYGAQHFASMRCR